MRFDNLYITISHAPFFQDEFPLMAAKWDCMTRVWTGAGPGRGGGALPYMGYIGMCRCEGYDFQAVYSRIGYINQSVWSRIGYHFSGN